LPDKAVSLLDTACARVAVSQHAVPPEVDDCRRRIEALQTELDIIGREEPSASMSASARETRRTRWPKSRPGCATRSRWKEKALVEKILALRADLRGSGDGAIEAAVQGATEQVAAAAPPVRWPAHRGGRTAPKPYRSAPRCSNSEHARLQDELRILQGETPLILPSVDETAVASVVADWTGIPVGRMVKNEIEAVLATSPTPQCPHHRPAPRAGDDRPADPDLARPPRQPRTSRSASSCSPAPRASARPKPPWPWPKACTAASRTSSPST
jgi:type VI secretion system protein VasG